jgi:hypothetical protein
MAINFVLASPVVTDGLATGSEVSTVTPALPTGTASGDRVFVATVGTTAAGATPAGWTLVGTATLGTGTVAASAGTRVVTVWFRDYDGAWTMPAFTQASGATPTLVGAAVSYSKAANEVWGTPTFTTGSDTATAGTTYSATGAANLGVTAGDLLLAVQGNPSNITTTAGAMTATGLTMGTVNERVDGGSATGFDASIHVFEALPTAGTSTAAPVQTSTVSTTAQSSGGTMFVRQTVSVPNPKLATFTDDFATADTGKWSFPSNAAVTGGQLRLDPSPGYGGLYSNAAFDLGESEIIIEVPQAPNIGLGTTELFIYLNDEGGTGDVRFDINNGTLLAQTKLTAGSTTIGSAPYSATNHRWLRISETGGVVTWATSPNRTTWTTIGTWTRALYNVPAVHVGIGAGYWGAETDPGFGLLDNLNTAPPASTDYIATPADNAAATDAVSVQVAAQTGLSDAVAASDAVSVARTLAAIADAAAATDVASSTATLARTVADTAAASDTAAFVQSQTIPAVDTAAATDAVTFVRAVQVTLSDAAGATDAASYISAMQSAAADAAAASDAVAFVQAANRTASDAASAVDAVALTAATQRALADVAGASDSASTLLTTPRTYYVAGTGGSDAADGQSTGAAWATITKVNATTFNPGDTVLFQRGVTFSNAALVCDDSGTATQRIVFGAYGSGALPVFDGGGVGIPIKMAGNFVTVQDVQVQNSGGAYPNEYGLAMVGTDGLAQRCVATHNVFGIGIQDGAHRSRVTQCDCSTNDKIVVGAGPDDDYGGNGVAIGAADDCEVDHNTLTSNYGPSPDYGQDGSAIEVFGSINAVIHHNRSHNNPNFTEVGHTRTTGVVFHHNVITADDAAPDGSAGFNLQGTGTYGPVTNISIHHNSVRMADTGFTYQGIIVGPGVTASVHNNVVDVPYCGWFGGQKINEGHNVWYGNTADIWSTANSGNGIASTSVVADPLFVSPGTFDLHLKTGSPAINRAFDYGYATDFDGNSRISAGAPDAGAYELQASVSPADTAGVTDLVTTTVTAARAAADAAAGTDAVSLLVGVATAGDVAGASDAAAVTVAMQRALVDAAGAADAVGVVQAQQLTVADAAAAVDAASAVQTLSRAAADTAAATDGVSTVASYSVTVTDAAGAVDAATTSRATTAADAAAAVDAATTTLAAQIVLTDTAAATDAVSVNASGALSASAADTAAAVDATATTVAASRALADAAGATDSVTAAIVVLASAADAAAATDAVTTSSGMDRAATDAAAATDAVTWTAASSVTVSDAAAATDATAVAQSMTRSAADAAAAVDAVTTGSTAQLQASAADSAAAVDAVSTSLSGGAAPADAAAVSDAVSYTMVRFVTVADMAAASDAQGQQRTVEWTATDVAGAVDAVAAVVADAGLMTVEWHLRYGTVSGRFRAGDVTGRLKV